MGRRSDHTPAQLRSLFVKHGHALLAEKGFAKFSGREAAKRAGYSVGSIYNAFGSLDGLIVAINTYSFTLWAAHLEARLALADGDRIAALVEGYFDFALANPAIWSAIYEHRLPEGASLSEEDLQTRSALTAIVEREVAAALPGNAHLDIGRYARSLIATVHGHCSYVVSGTYALFDEPDPVGMALARVRESLAAHGQK